MDKPFNTTLYSRSFVESLHRDARENEEKLEQSCYALIAAVMALVCVLVMGYLISL